MMKVNRDHWNKYVCTHTRHNVHRMDGVEWGRGDGAFTSRPTAVSLNMTMMNSKTFDIAWTIQ